MAPLSVLLSYECSKESKGPCRFVTSIPKAHGEGGGGGVLEICHVVAVFIAFKQ